MLTCLVKRSILNPTLFFSASVNFLFVNISNFQLLNVHVLLGNTKGAKKSFCVFVFSTKLHKSERSDSQTIHCAFVLTSCPFGIHSSQLSSFARASQTNSLVFDVVAAFAQIKSLLIRSLPSSLTKFDCVFNRIRCAAFYSMPHLSVHVRTSKQVVPAAVFGFVFRLPRVISCGTFNLSTLSAFVESCCFNSWCYYC